VVIAVIAVAMVQMPVDEIVDVVAVGYSFVAALLSVLVRLYMTGAGVVRGAGGRVGSRHGQDVLVNVALVHVVEMALVQVVCVVAVTDGGVAAVGSVGVLMVLVYGMGGHTVPPDID
jgi:hypothetical protein